MNAPHFGALVFCGATGRIASKKIFPSLQALLAAGPLDVPVIDMVKAGWHLDQLKARSKDGLERHEGLDAAAFAKLSRPLHYVDGEDAKLGGHGTDLMVQFPLSGVRRA